MEGNELLRYGKISEYNFCDELAEMHMIIHGNIVGNDKVIYTCCEIPGRPAIGFENTPQETYDKFFGLRARCVGEYIIGRKKQESTLGYGCSSCERLSKRDHLWSYSPFISVVNLTPLPSPCQCKCIYCDREKTRYIWQDSSEVRLAYEKMFELVEYGKDMNLIWEHAVWQVSPGEITIHPFKEHFLELIHDKNTYLLSNGFIFDEDIAHILHDNPLAKFNISLDSGTANTWKEVKGFDNFSEVRKNLEKYASSCYDVRTQLKLKYIVLPGINDNENDFQSFIEFALSIGVSWIIISRDIRGKFSRNDKMYQDSIQSAARLLNKCRSHNMSVEYAVFSPQEQSKIKDISKSLR